MQPRNLELPGADGIKLAALEWSTEGVPLVFVHGFGNDAHVWDEVAPCVSPYYRTVALTLRGHGDSGRGASRAGDVMARDLECALESLGFERLVLVAHSLGGRVAMQFADRNPEKLAGLVLVDSGPEHDTRGTTRIRDETRSQVERSDPSFASLADYQRVLERQYPAARQETLAKLAVHWTRRREDGRYELKLDLRPPADRGNPAPVDPAQVRARAREERDRLWNALRKLECPVLVVRGAASDVLSPEVADRMVDETLRKGTLAVIPHAGHSVMLDNPEAFNRALTDFALG